MELGLGSSVAMLYLTKLLAEEVFETFSINEVIFHNLLVSLYHHCDPPVGQYAGYRVVECKHSYLPPTYTMQGIQGK